MHLNIEALWERLSRRVRCVLWLMDLEFVSRDKI